MLTLTRRSMLASTALAAVLPGLRAVAAPAGGTLNIACIFDPPGLDPTVNAVDLVSTITENVFDTLYAFDAKWQPAPLLAAALPTLTDGGKTVTIPLRTGVAFHDATALTSRGEASAIVGRLSSDDAQSGLCSKNGLALFNGAPLRTMPQLDRDGLASLEFGSGRDYNFFAWVDSTCQGTLLAVVSLMRNEDVEVRLFKPAALPAPGAGPELQPGFGLFTLQRRDAGCSF